MGDYSERTEPCPCGKGTVTKASYEAYDDWSSKRDYHNKPIQVSCTNGCKLTPCSSYDYKTGEVSYYNIVEAV